jgi:hypothetical protein
MRYRPPSNATKIAVELSTSQTRPGVLSASGAG